MPVQEFTTALFQLVALFAGVSFVFVVGALFKVFTAAQIASRGKK